MSRANPFASDIVIARVSIANMDILMTGGTGLIGRALCVALLRDGHALTVLSRKPKTVAAKCGAAVRAIGSLDEWSPEQNFDAIINLAGEPIVDAAWTRARKKRLWQSRVTLTEQLVHRIATANKRPAVLLSGSAIGYYGDSGDLALDEAGSVGPGVGSDFGAQLCAAWEAAANKANQSDVRVCLLRTGLVMTAQGGMLKKLRLPFLLGFGARLGGGKQWMSWIHIDDYVAIVRMLLLHTGASGPVNMTAPTPVTNADFTTTLAQALHRPAFVVAPAALLKALLGERSVLLLGGQKVLPRKVEALGYRFQYATLDTALRAEFV